MISKDSIVDIIVLSWAEPLQCIVNQYLDACISKICAFLVIICFVVVESVVTLSEQKKGKIVNDKITKNVDPDNDHKTI